MMKNRTENSVKNAWQYVAKVKLAVVFLILTCTNVNAQKTPTYSQYAVKVEQKSAKSVNLKSHPEARMYRTNLRNALANGQTNFAGRYILTTWGCGTGCLQGAIMDVKTGNVSFPLELQAVSAGSITLGDHDIVEYRKNSNLLVIYGYKGVGFEAENQSQHGIYYYQWNGKSLKLIKFVKKSLD